MAQGLTRRAFRAAGMFGSVQVVQMLCTMARMKLISVWIGPLGVGLMGLYMSAFEMITNFTQFNIRTAAVRDLSMSASDAGRMQVVTSVVRRYAWILGVLGALVMFVCAVPLSHYSFSDSGHAVSFRLLAAAVLFRSLTGGEQAILQGHDRLKELAAGGLWSSAGGLLLSVPLYRFLGVEGIVPSIVVYTFCAWVGVAVYRRRTSRRPEITVSASDTLRLGLDFMKVGFYLTMASAIGSVVNYVMLVYVKSHAGETALGCFQAGYAMLWRYAAMVFVSVSFEYYPRLASVSGSRWRMSVMVGHESEFIGRMLLPCACAAIAASPLLVRMLYSQDFMPVLPYFVWGMAGMMVRPLSMAMSYSFLAMGRGREFCLTEVASGIVGLVINILAFRLCGFAGLGIGLIVWMGVDVRIMYAVYRRQGLGLGRGVVLSGIARVSVAGVCAALQMCGLWWAVAVIAALSAVPAVKMLRN